MKGILEEYLRSFPAVVLTGARQVGKTTLLKSLLSKSHRYVLLEDPDVRGQAQDDPRSFLSHYPPPVIFDEFQYVPHLTSYLQGLIDQDRQKTGQFVLTGSQNFLMMEQVSQSLAGRVGLLSLYGLEREELPLPKGPLHEERDIAQILYRGTFPELWMKRDLKPSHWFGSYLRTYLERDVRNLTQVGNLLSFERFIRLCAIRTGQILNLSELARDCGISQPTAQRWLSILIQTYQVHLIEPFYENLSSRIRKSPKIYFMDTGLASYLMGFRNASLIPHSPQLGALFETLVITNFIKFHAAEGEVPEHYYIQAKTGLEVDLMLRRGTSWALYEIKYRRTLGSQDLKQLLDAKEILKKKVVGLYRLSPVSESFVQKEVTLHPWDQVWEIQKRESIASNSGKS
ncbi:MAG: ATP-binding protein [Chlamydiae bacterium]|nr:ATP-binding protein [Chlamydiota bacterium]MBI3276569.1 ATP-binding protein [Chlamydiota bacterium]